MVNKIHRLKTRKSYKWSDNLKIKRIIFMKG